MHNRKIVRFQGQIETALKIFWAGLELRIKELFAVLHIQSHLTGAGIRKLEWIRFSWTREWDKISGPGGLEDGTGWDVDPEGGRRDAVGQAEAPLGM